jgi:hypothetical protein
MGEWPVPRTSSEQFAWPDPMSGADVLRMSALNAGRERALAAGIEKLRRLVEAGDPEIIEDLASLSESAPYVVSFGEASEPMDCERCRVPVVAVPENPDRGTVGNAPLGAGHLGSGDGAQARDQAVRGDAGGEIAPPVDSENRPALPHAGRAGRKNRAGRVSGWRLRTLSELRDIGLRNGDGVRERGAKLG